MDEEAVDFDFFDEGPTSPSKDDFKSSPDGSKSKPPVRPRSAKPVFMSDSVKDKDTKSREKQKKDRSPSISDSSSPHYSSDSFSDSDSNKSQERGRGRKVKSRHSSSSVSSSGSHSCSSESSYSSRSRTQSNSHSRSPPKVNNKSHNNSNGSSNDKRQSLPKRGRSRQGEDEYSSSAYSEGDESTSKNSTVVCHDDGDHKRDKKNMKSRGRQQAWGETNSSSKPKNKMDYRDRPKTAKGRLDRNSDRHRQRRSRSDSDTLSESDITDVSPMDSPRNGSHGKSKEKTKGSFEVVASGDGKPIRVQYKALPVTDLDLKETDDDPDRTHGLDLDILMKAVGELEKQKRLQANSRRVMFAPMNLKRGEKSNYTFDKDKTRDIEKENQRLLKEIVRRVSSGEQRREFYRPKSAYKLTPSAVNREKEMKRIETENLAFLKRLQKIQPTRTICRDNQLRDYETTTLHGVPIAALHPLPKTKRRGYLADDSSSSIGGRTRSMTSLHSATSSVVSVGSRRSSRPSSATKRPGSATKRIDTRPEWSDRW